MSQVFDVDDSGFDAEVMQANLPVLVDFSADWCGPCKKLEPVVKEIAGDYDARLKVVRIDVDKAPATAAKFGVLSIPTLLFFKAGTVKGQITGAVSKRALSDKIEEII
jgi:thioredoxin 1